MDPAPTNVAQTPPERRCLIVERNAWETGAYYHQLQFPLAAARLFFGPDNVDRTITVRMFAPGAYTTPFIQTDMVISRRYQPSATRRTNQVPQIGLIPPSFVFFEETDTPDLYDLWWQTDMPVVAARFPRWRQGRSNQRRRGRLWTIVSAPVPRPITTIR